MTKQLTNFSGSAMSLTDIQQLGQHFIKSGFFSDSRDLSQAVVKIVAGKEMGIEAFAAMSGINIIKGKPTIGAGLMAGRVKASGKYDYRVKEHSASLCTIAFFENNKEVGQSAFTMQDANNAGLSGNSNWKKHPKNMLFARALSNGVKWFCPDVFTTPVYVPEEMEAVINEEGNNNGNQKQNLEPETHQPEIINVEMEEVEETDIINPVEEVEGAADKEGLLSVMKKYNGLTKTNPEYKAAVDAKITEFLTADFKEFSGLASELNTVPELMDLAASDNYKGLRNHPDWSEKLEELLEVHSSCIRQKEKAKEVLQAFKGIEDLTVFLELKEKHKLALDTDPGLRKKVKDLEEVLKAVENIEDIPPF